MRAAKQGAFDGLCGVYSVLNALELLGLGGRRSRMHEEFFTELTYGLGAAAILGAMSGGLLATDLVRASDVAFRWLSAHHGFELEMSQPFLDHQPRTVTSYIKKLQAHVRAPNNAVIIRFKIPRLGHWSVIKGLTKDEVFLRDSLGLISLSTARFELNRGDHQFSPLDTLLIQRWL